MASRATPPPTDRLVTPPPAPRFGTFHDDWNPRRSARISSQSTSRTPDSTSPNGYASHSASQSPRKRPAPDRVQRASAAVVSASEGSAAQVKHGRRIGTDILLTPSKTPQKNSKGKATTDVGSFACNLFPSESGEPSSSKKQHKTKKYSGMTLDSFRAEVVEEPLEIFTDSRDRVPGRDQGNDNPFYGTQPPQEGEARRRSRRAKVHVPGEGRQSIEDAVQREDGMVYTFRGKKVFRKYSEQEPQTAITGRLLFPSHAIEDEEAATDIEDENMENEDEAELEPQTPAKHTRTTKGKVDAPSASKFEPLSPPETSKTKRTTDKLQAADITQPKLSGIKNPFDGWLRRKNSSEVSPSKRKSDSLGSTSAKRSRVQQ